MLKAGLFKKFKGATTLLVWGDGAGMGKLFGSLLSMRDGFADYLAIDGPNGVIGLCSADAAGELSTLRADGNRLCWTCSLETIELAADLVEPLVIGKGHQFLDVNGLADQIIIARDEYPADLR